MNTKSDNEKIRQAGQCLVNVANCSIFLIITICVNFISYFIIEDLESLKTVTALLAIVIIYFTASSILNFYKAGKSLINIKIETGLEDSKKELDWKRIEFEKKLNEINKR